MFDIFGDIGWNNFFKVISKIFPFLEMLIFLDIWTKKLFIQRDLKKSTFSLNFYIFGDMGKKRFFQSDLKINFLFLEMLIFLICGKNDFFKMISNNAIFSKFGYFWTYGQITIFSKWSENKLPFPRNVDIFGCIVENRLFQSDFKITPPK